MFAKKKQAEPAIPMECKTPAPVRSSLIDKLRDRRTEKVKAANDLDREIAALDQEITWLERNPKANHIIEDVLQQEVERQLPGFLKE